MLSSVFLPGKYRYIFHGIRPSHWLSGLLLRQPRASVFAYRLRVALAKTSIFLFGCEDFNIEMTRATFGTDYYSLFWPTIVLLTDEGSSTIVSEEPPNR